MELISNLSNIHIRTVKQNYGSSLIIPMNHSGGTTHGIALEDHNRVYLIWVAGSANNWVVNSKLIFGTNSNRTFSIATSTGVVTIRTTDNGNHRLLYIGW